MNTRLYWRNETSAVVAGPSPQAQINDAAASNVSADRLVAEGVYYSEKRGTRRRGESFPMRRGMNSLQETMLMIVSRFPQRIGLIAIAGCLASVVAQAQSNAVVFSNLTTPDPVHICQVFGSTSAPQTCAAQFTASGNFNLVDAKVMVGTEPSGGPNFNLWIAADAGGVPGTFIEQIGFNLAATSSSGSVVTASSIATPVTLTSGTKYWLVMTPANQQTGVSWEGSGSSAVPLTFSSSPTFNSGWAAATNYPIQFQIDATPTSGGPSPSPTPIPPSIILGLTAIGGVGLWQLRRTRAARSVI